MMRLFRVFTLFVTLYLCACGLLQAGPFYVVVGMFTDEPAALQVSANLAPLFKESSVRFDVRSKMYLVYLMETNRQGDAEVFRHRLTAEYGFQSVWIFLDPDTGAMGGTGSAPDDYVKMELFTGGSVLLSSTDKTYLSISKNKDERKDASAPSTARLFTFIAETPSGWKIDGNIVLSDESGKMLSTFTTGEVVKLGGRHERRIIRLECTVGGFNKVSKVIDLGSLFNTLDINQNADDVWEVRFKLSKLRAGEMTLQFHRMFYPESAIFEPSSAHQTKLLVALIVANPSWRIVINSHCRDGRKRDVKLAGRDGDYRNLSGAIAKGATGKQLTKERAENLRDYLMEMGIDGDRVSTMGWGDLAPLVKDPAGSVWMNERVEVRLIP